MRQQPPKVMTARVLLVLSLGLNAILVEISMLRTMEARDSGPGATSSESASSSSSSSFPTTKTHTPLPPPGSSSTTPIIFGHLHYPKTAGTNINGELAAHFERVCGHKGYSFDAHQTQIRRQQQARPHAVGATMTSANDSISLLYPTFHRGRVPLELMWERGFEDCDWISLEAPWEQWLEIRSVLLATHMQNINNNISNSNSNSNNNKSYKSILPLPTLELHVPCRFDSIDHLMSQCNHKEITFDCSVAATTSTMLQRQVDQCLMGTNRFDDNLQPPPQEERQGEQQPMQDQWTLKCFDPIPIHPYLNHVGQFLQRKRIETTYQHQFKNNKSRNHTNPTSNENECIWERPDLQHQLRRLLKRMDYYRFCHKCLGSNNDLLLKKQEKPLIGGAIVNA